MLAKERGFEQDNTQRDTQGATPRGRSATTGADPTVTPIDPPLVLTTTGKVKLAMSNAVVSQMSALADSMFVIESTTASSLFNIARSEGAIYSCGDVLSNPWGMAFDCADPQHEDQPSLLYVTNNSNHCVQVRA